MKRVTSVSVDGTVAPLKGDELEAQESLILAEEVPEGMARARRPAS
jgi:hypothetical protein